jgi:hypothetical protein
MLVWTEICTSGGEEDRRQLACSTQVSEGYHQQSCCTADGGDDAVAVTMQTMPVCLNADDACLSQCRRCLSVSMQTMPVCLRLQPTHILKSAADDLPQDASLLCVMACLCDRPAGGSAVVA